MGMLALVIRVFLSAFDLINHHGQQFVKVIAVYACDVEEHTHHISQFVNLAFSVLKGKGVKEFVIFLAELAQSPTQIGIEFLVEVLDRKSVV